MNSKVLFSSVCPDSEMWDDQVATVNRKLMSRLYSLSLEHMYSSQWRKRKAVASHLTVVGVVFDVSSRVSQESCRVTSKKKEGGRFADLKSIRVSGLDWDQFRPSFISFASSFSRIAFSLFCSVLLFLFDVSHLQRRDDEDERGGGVVLLHVRRREKIKWSFPCPSLQDSDLLSH